MIQTKPIPRLSDGITKWASPRVVNHNTPSYFGFAIRTLNAPMLITNFGIGVYGLDVSVPMLFNVHTIDHSNWASILGNSISGQASAIASPLCNTGQDVQIKGVVLDNVIGNTGTQIFNGIIDLHQPEWGQYTAATKGQVGFGKFRGAFSRLIRPNSALLIVSASPMTIPIGETLTAYLEWIEGDYDYEPLMQGGRL